MGDTLSKQMSSTETLPFKEEQAHCNNKTSENQPKIIDDNKCTDSQDTDSQHTDSQNTDSKHTDSQNTDSKHIDSQNTDSQHTDSQNTDSQHTDSQNTDSSEVYSMALNKDWHLYVMI
ncbi:hypothetical protein [African swine fever virus]|uniref:BA71V-L60L n=1 Tax=African swine fever virus TaxID=10497 RepID=A0A895A3C7_ASF|nr:BA71V-L60L [African swine fever virus]